MLERNNFIGLVAHTKMWVDALWQPELSTMLEQVEHEQVVRTERGVTGALHMCVLRPGRVVGGTDDRYTSSSWQRVNYYTKG